MYAIRSYYDLKIECPLFYLTVKYIKIETQKIIIYQIHKKTMSKIIFMIHGMMVGLGVGIITKTTLKGKVTPVFLQH